MLENNNSSTNFPPQKKSDSEKTEDWGKKCIQAADSFNFYTDEKLRQSQYNKRINYQLFDDILEEADIHRVCNPLQIKNFTAPAKMQNYPAVNPNITLLIGEESKRKFEYRVVVGNEDAISQKEQTKKQEIIGLLEQDLLEEYDDQRAKQVLESLTELKTNYQDDRENLATQILSYLYKEQDIKRKFNDGFKDSLLVGEEFYCCDIVAGEPIVRRVNPLCLTTFRSGDSPYIEDSDIIVEDTYMSPGQINDHYYDHLSPAQISKIEKGLTDVAVNNGGVLNYGKDAVRFDATLSTELGNALTTTNTNGYGTGAIYDEYGNIRVVRVVWKSLRKLFELTYIDEFGEEQLDIVDERYKVNKAAGEKVKELWVNEWWEGTRIGNDIYVKIQPRPVQFRSMTNLSKCLPGYVGTIYNTNDGKAKSLMDRLKPYQYLYNVFMYRLEHAFAKYKGPIYELDLSKIPEDWEVDEWLYYAESMGWAPIDPFNEGKHGAATGKLSGSFNTTGKVLDADGSNYIRSTMEMLRYLSEQIDQISGVTSQRKGAISSSELVGNVERSVTQSSHITEPYFFAHDNTKVRVLKTLLETAKVAWKGKIKKLQYILDDMSISMLNVDGDLFNEAEYDIHITNSSKALELESALKQLAQAGLQNDKLNFTQIIDIYNTESISKLGRKIEAAERKKDEAMQQQAQAEQKAEQDKIAQMKEIADQAQQLEVAKLDLERYKIDMDNQTKVRVAELNAYMKQTELDQNNNGIPDPMEIAHLALAEQDAMHVQSMDLQENFRKEKELDAKQSLERQKYNDQKEIEKLRLKQIEVQNQNQEKLQREKLAMEEKMMKEKIKIERIKAAKKNTKK